MKKAVIFGATGFIGSYLLTDLLKNSEYEQVIIVVRKAPNIVHPKIKVLNGDLSSLQSLKKDLIADEVFIAVGTTRKKTPNQNEFYKIDHDYPVLAAKLAKENGAKSVFLVSVVGASEKSKSFYVKTKGDTERDIAALGYEHVHIFRPSMLLGPRQEYRLTEKIVVPLLSLIDSFFLGMLNPFKGIKGEDVAIAMVAAAQSRTDKIKTYHWSEMHALIKARRPAEKN